MIRAVLWLIVAGVILFVNVTVIAACWRAGTLRRRHRRRERERREADALRDEWRLP